MKDGGVFIISSHFSAPSSLLNAPSHAKVTSFSSLFFKKSSFFFSRRLLLATYWIRMAGMPPVRLFLSIDSYYPPMSNIPACSFLLPQNIDSAPRPTDNPNIPTDDRFLRQALLEFIRPIHQMRSIGIGRNAKHIILQAFIFARQLYSPPLQGIRGHQIAMRRRRGTIEVSCPM